MGPNALDAIRKLEARREDDTVMVGDLMPILYLLLEILGLAALPVEGMIRSKGRAVPDDFGLTILRKEAEAGQAIDRVEELFKDLAT